MQGHFFKEGWRAGKFQFAVALVRHRKIYANKLKVNWISRPNLELLDHDANMRNL